jgi:hypothetical protein
MTEKPPTKPSVVAMRLSDLNKQQLATLSVHLERRLAYLTKLRERMESNKFPRHDRFFRDISIIERLLKDAVDDVKNTISFKGRQ